MKLTETPRIRRDRVPASLVYAFSWSIFLVVLLTEIQRLLRHNILAKTLLKLCKGYLTVFVLIKLVKKFNNLILRKVKAPFIEYLFHSLKIDDSVSCITQLKKALFQAFGAVEQFLNENLLDIFFIIVSLNLRPIIKGSHEVVVRMSNEWRKVWIALGAFQVCWRRGYIMSL